MKNLETDRLILRRVRLEDVNDLYEYSSDDRVQIPAGSKKVYNIFEMMKRIEKLIKRDDILVIELKSNRKVIGAIGAYNLTYNDIIERHIGFELNYDYWNNGYITEACNVVIKYLFEELNMDRVAMSHYPFNKTSERVAQKLGFTKEGILRKEDKIATGEIVDRIIYSIIKDEYFERLQGGKSNE
ncbi:GNAT family N-acetyltransferase [Mycoplasmatota bacterium]|nr:GNAT family N-acetyltransferase [Mycoplasmatota bacterium]